MNLRLEMTQNIELRLELTGGWTTSIFPQVEEWLEADSDRVHVLRSVCFKQGPYQSVIDYLYANVIAERRSEVFCFYQGTGPKALDILTNAQRLTYQARILACLELLYETRQQRLGRLSWKQVRTTIERLAA